MPQAQNQHDATNTRDGREALALWRWALLVALAAGATAVLAILFSKLEWFEVPYIFVSIGRMLRGSWEFPVRSAIGLGVCSAEVAGLFGLGYGLLSFIRPWRRAVPLIAERAALALPVAGVPVALAVLGLGLAGSANAAAYGALLAVLFTAGLPGWVALTRDFRSYRSYRSHWSYRSHSWSHFLVGFLLLIALVYALSPATESDEVRYHLAAPATWLRDGRIHYLHYQAFSNFPMLGEMLFMPALAVGGEEAAKPIHLAFLLACMGLIGVIGLRIERMRNAECGMRNGKQSDIPHSAFRIPHLFALLPCVLIIAGWGWIDLFVVAYFLAFVYLTGRALMHPRRASASLIGLAAGGGIGVKYTMLALLGGLGKLWFLFLILVLVSRNRNRNRLIFQLGLGVAFFALLFGGAWYVKNFVWTHNPLYPGGISIFGEGEWTKANADFFMKKSQGNAGMHLDWPKGTAGKIAEFIISPVTATLHPERFENNPLGPLPLLAALAALGGLVARRRSCAKRFGVRQRAAAFARPFNIWILIALVTSWAVWFMTYQSNRFLMPTAALALAFGGAALAPRALPSTARLWQKIMRALIGLGVIYSFLLTLIVMLNPPKIDAIAVGLGFKNRGDYLAERLNYWRPAQWLARRARPGEKALLVGEHRTMHFALPVVASDWFDTPQPIPWMRETKTNNEMLDLLLKNGVRYIFFNMAELQMGDQYHMFFLPRFTTEERKRFDDLWKNPRLKQIYPAAEHDGIFIFEIEKP